MSTHGAEWDEYRTQARTPSNYISFPTSGKVHKTTTKALPWKIQSADPGRAIIASVWIENLFDRAPVDDPHDLNSMTLLTRC